MANPMLRKESVLQNAPQLIPIEQSAGLGSLKEDSEITMGSIGAMRLKNPHISDLSVDYLYHLGLDTSMPLREMFGDVKFVCMGGSNRRMLEFAKKVAVDLKIKLPTGTDLSDISKTDRYCMYKAGPVISVSHGMGIPSISILLHEITKMLHYANATDVIFIRIGSSGGLGVPAGSIVITSEALDGELNPHHTIKVLGEKVYRDAKFDQKLLEEIASCKEPDMNVLIGKTMCAEDFYEGQARLDGAICEYPKDAKFKFFEKAIAAGVVNIEMESLEFAAFTWKLQIPAIVLCATYLNRMETDQVSAAPEVLHEYSDRPQRLCIDFMRKRLSEYAQKAPSH